MSSRKLIPAWLMIGLILSVLSACGRTERPAIPPDQANMIDQSGQTGATATMVPIDPADPLQIKATIAFEGTREVQTALAGTPPPIEPAPTDHPTTWPPPTPYFANATPLTGGGRIIDIPNAVIGRRFNALNSWAILPTVDTVLIVKAGGDYATGNQEDLVQGGLIIEKYDNGAKGQLIKQDYYATPFKTGKARVVDALVSGTTMNVRITTENGSTWWFDVTNRQWLTTNATVVPTTLPPVATATPTPTPVGQWVQSLTLFNADTDQIVTGFDPLVNSATLNFATLGTRNLNIRANTAPATVGSVTFTLDGTLIRTEGGAPYALAGNDGANYYAWTPSLGSHTLVVKPYSGGNATGTLGTALTVTFTVVEGTSVTATATSVPAATATRTLTPVATATRTNTPVPATATPIPATVTPGGTAKTALFVVNNATALNAGDTAVQTRLIGLGYSVTPKTASTTVTSDATGKTLVLISSSVASGDVASKFKSVTVPVIVWEQALYDDMALTGTIATTDYGTASSNSLVISNAGHPLAGGLSGTVTVFNAVAAMPYGVPSANAISLAPQGTSNSKKVYFAYDKNAAMVGGLTVNARRVGLFWIDIATATPNAWTLFDAAVNWATAP